jgi:uncharacterized protein YukE
MIAFAGDVSARNTTFTARVEQMHRDVDAAMDTWRGEAATAASARGLAEVLAANHLGSAVMSLADTFNAYGGELGGYRAGLLGIVDDEVPAAGMSAAHDPVPLYTEISGYFTANYGPSPTDAGFGGRVFASDPGTPGPWYTDWYKPAAHSQYWDQNCKSLPGMGDIIAGHGVEAVNIK